MYLWWKLLGWDDAVWDLIWEWLFYYSITINMSSLISEGELRADNFSCPWTPDQNRSQHGMGTGQRSSNKIQWVPLKRSTRIHSNPTLKSTCKQTGATYYPVRYPEKLLPLLANLVPKQEVAWDWNLQPVTDFCFYYHYDLSLVLTLIIP